ncbi:iron ABC transporter permease [Parvularcula dongshanensis]|uniref:Iron(III) transport system permease protein n=1 Tax=Parvularcula dongshanensis TaxID=1173995 RepID=A0A840I5D0_9PROT|nr:iron(III) transport system permease protein [Parvularcula dongshanensis]
MAVALLAGLPLIAVLWGSVARPGDLVSLIVTTLPPYLANTLGLALIVGALTTLIGVGTAWLVTATEFRGRRTLSWLLVLPLAAPAYLVAYVYTDLLAYAGPVQGALRAVFGPAGSDWVPPVRSLPGAGLMLALVLYPYVYLLSRAAFAAQSRSQLLAARSLGARPMTAFRRVVLPAARPAIAGGLALVLMETLADFGVADYFAIPTFSTGIFRTWLALGDRQTALQLAGVLLLFVFLLVAVEASSRRGLVASGDRLSEGVPPFSLSRGQGVLAVLACSLPIVLGFAVPVGVLTVLAIGGGDDMSAEALRGYAKNSVGVALLTAGIATLLALLLGYARRRAPRRGVVGGAVRGGLRLATLGYALPGTLLAVGLLAPLGGFDRWLTRLSREVTGIDHGLLLTGSVALLTYALTVRFLTVSFNAVGGGLDKIPPSLDEAARSLGAGPQVVVRRVHVPLLASSLLASASLVFVDVMRELPATLMLRPFDFETLATRVYRLASDERLAEASTAALLIILVGIPPVMLLNRVRR